jgi:hypothetical protein
MSQPSLLQFRLLPPEAKRAALQRLALRGCDLASISAQTGLDEGEIRRLAEPPLLTRAPRVRDRAPAMRSVSAAHGVRRGGYNTRFLESTGAESRSAP